ncbi:MAG: PIN domain-containing protein [Bacilli bacterium]
MPKQTAVSDTDFCIHLLNGNTENWATQFFDPIYLDEFNANKEFPKHAEKGRSIPPFFHVIDRQYLIDRQVSRLYDARLDDMRYLFLPKNEGEKKGIALALAMGISVFLSDDVAASGPHQTINAGPDPLVCLSSADLLCLNILSRVFAFHDGIEALNQFFAEVYSDNPPTAKNRTAKFTRSILDSSRPFTKAWYANWKSNYDVTSADEVAFLSQCKRLGVYLTK